MTNLRKKDSSVDSMDISEEAPAVVTPSNFATQILILYYVLLYHDTLLSNMKSTGENVI